VLAQSMWIAWSYKFKARWLSSKIVPILTVYDNTRAKLGIDDVERTKRAINGMVSKQLNYRDSPATRGLS
jgi:hypothetical protein